MQRLSGCLQGKVVASTINLHSNLQLSVEQRRFEWKARVAVTLRYLHRQILHILGYTLTPGGGLPYETDGDARRKFGI